MGKSTRRFVQAIEPSKKMARILPSILQPGLWGRWYKELVIAWRITYHNKKAPFVVGGQGPMRARGYEGHHIHCTFDGFDLDGFQLKASAHDRGGRGMLRSMQSWPSAK